MFKKMTSEEYHAHRAVGSSTLKLARQSLAKFKAQRDGLIAAKESDAFDLGTAAHAAILEQDFQKYVCGPDAAKNTKVWKEFEQANSDKICLQPKHFSLIKGMYEAYFSHPLVPKITNKGVAEASFFCTIGGQEYKARPDYLVEDGDGFYIVDYKTATSADYEFFQRQVGDYGYDLSAAHYMRVVEQVTGKKVKEYYWIVQEKEAPFEVAVYRMDDQCRERALIAVDKIYAKISEANATGKWPSRFQPEILDIDLNSYAIAKEEMNG